MGSLEIRARVRCKLRETTREFWATRETLGPISTPPWLPARWEVLSRRILGESRRSAIFCPDCIFQATTGGWQRRRSAKTGGESGGQ